MRMKLLAIETSTEFCSLALWLDGEIFVREELALQRHSQILLPMLQTLLADNAMTLAHLDCIAFGAGPGSFTGLRIACGVAQGLAYGAHKPVVAVSTLNAIAETTGAERVITALDARMGEIYHASYEKTAGVWQEITRPALCLPQNAPAVTGHDWLGAGSGFLVHGESLSQRYSGQLCETMGSARPRAREIAVLGIAAWHAGLGVEAAQARPVYIRDKVAMTRRERAPNL